MIFSVSDKAPLMRRLSPQFLKIMKLTAVLLTIAFLQVHAKSFPQVTLSLKNVPVEKVFYEIERQAGYGFLYTKTMLSGLPNVTIKVKNAPVKEVLNECFKGQPMEYSIENNTIVVTRKAAADPARLADPVTVPPVQIRGRVLSSGGEPLSNVSVLIVGTPVGTTTDAEGRFMLTAPDDKNVVLEFSSVGYIKKRINVGKQTEINVVLEMDIAGLSDVVVIGYGTQKRRDISTSISSVSAENIKDKPVSSFAQAITGQMAGVRILNSNNAPGGGTNIILRGINSINASNNPLVVIDGFPLKDGFDQTQNPLNAINPADIESIEVLKDASAGAIYGSQAANGVIIITTKKGKSGKPTININISTGYEKMMNKMNVLNREDFLQYMDDARAQAYIAEDPNFGTDDPNAPLWQWTDEDAVRIYNWTNFSSMKDEMTPGGTLYERWATVIPEVKAQPYNTDWQDAVTQVGEVQHIQLSTTGGTENLKYMLSAGYYDQDGIMKAGGYKRYSLRANVELKVNKWLKTGVLLAPSLENLDVIDNLYNRFHDIAVMPPLFAVYDENGNPKHLATAPDVYSVLPYDWKLWNVTETKVNPLLSDLIKDNRRIVRNLSTVYGEIDITKDLVFRSEFHTEFRNSERNYFLPSSFPAGSRPSRPRGINDINTRLYWNSQNFLTYDRRLGKHSLNAIVGYSVDESSSRGTYIDKYDYPTDQVLTLNQATTIINSREDARTNRFSEANIGSFARVMYNYAGKYYFTGSVRYDGSSKFGADSKWGTFPSFSLAWRVSDESFFDPIRQYINDFKIRGGWGVIGNSGIGNYNALSTLTATSYVLGKDSKISSGYVDGRVANALLGWESTTEYGIAADIELLKSRILFSVDYFYRLTEDMLFRMPLPTITGFDSYMKNIGSMRNRGFEYAVRTRNFVGDFNWSTTFNLSYYRNRVLNTGNDKRPLIDNNSYTIEGKPLAGIYATYFLGPYRDWEDVKTNPIVNPSNPQWMYRSYPGTAKLYDVNGDGVIDGLDNTIIGSPTPDFIWGMTNAFGYKGFELSIQVNGVQGGEHLITGRLETVLARGGGTENTTYSYYNNYWRPDRTDAKYTAPSRKSWDETSNVGTLIFKSTYVNFQNVTLGYTLPQDILKRMSLNQLRIYASIQNALLLTKYPGFNPEVNASGDSALSQAIDTGSYPMTRIVSFGLNVSL